MPSLLVALAAGAAAISPPAAETDLDVVGQASHRVAFWTIYDATLYAPGGRFSWDRPFALTLEYRRALSAARIADVSIDEMARIAGREAEAFAPLRGELTACFADVESGDRITGYALAADRAAFFHNGRKTCELERPGFGRDFFGIWLGDDTRQPEMSAQLKGAKS